MMRNKGPRVSALFGPMVCVANNGSNMLCTILMASSVPLHGEVNRSTNLENHVFVLARFDTDIEFGSHVKSTSEERVLDNDAPCCRLETPRVHLCPA